MEDVAKRQGKKVEELTILDAGCGTGNYAQHLHFKVQKYIGVEYNDGMCTKFRAKFQDKPNVILV